MDCHEEICSSDYDLSSAACVQPTKRIAHRPSHSLFIPIKSLVEEDFLRADPQYAAYMQRVRARWIPFLVCEETTFMSPQIQLKISTSLVQDVTIRLQLGDAI